MKIRGRLIVSFLIITLFPLCTGAICFHTIVQNQTQVLDTYYSTKTDNNDYGLVLNPVQTLYKLTLNDYNALVCIADEHPDKLLNINYLKETSDSLSSCDSFIVIRRGDENYYIGNHKYFKKMSPLPSFSEYQSGNNNTISIDQNSSTLIREKDFYFEDGTQGQLFLVTNLSKLLPRWKTSLRDLALAFLLILLTTAAVLLIWLYHSIVKPLNILRVATMQIGGGQLDNPVHVTSSDEIGELCRDFEEMRIRLKSMLEERIQYEQNTREMMSSISHDLKTPLTAIKGYSEGLIDGVASTPEKQEKYLKTIISKATDMTYLVDELSLFAKIEQNSLPYNFVSFNLGEYLSDCLADITFDLESQGITLTYENSTNPDTVILADPEQLKRVINNITGNAVKYMDKEQGTIRITVTDVTRINTSRPLYRQINEDGSDVTPLQKPDEFIRIEIADNGPGIESKDLPYIFDRFYRADASRNSAKRGSGLGLAIVQKIISEHGGQIWAKSTEGAGTSIFFTLKKSNEH